MPTSPSRSTDASEPEGVSLLKSKGSPHKLSSSSSLPSSSSSNALAPPPAQSSGPRPISTAFKLLLFFSIVTWSTSAALIVRYSQGVLKEKYSIIGGVVVTEFIKLLLSTLAMCRDLKWGVFDTAKRCTSIMATSLPMAIPAIVYLVQNTLNYVALKSIASATHAILVQLKLLTTAIFAVIILRKQIFFFQWRALFLLFIGIVLVQWPTTAPTPPPAGPVADTAVGASLGEPLKVGGGGLTSMSMSDIVAKYGGVMAATTQAALSGFSGVYTEWRLKGRGSFTLWENNFQLCLYSILFGAASLLFSSSDMELISTKGFFSGYSIYTWSCIALNSWGGLMVAAILLYCDNILKNFASSVSILATSILGFFLYGEPQFSINFFCGACVLISAIFIYNEDIISLASHMQQSRKAAEDAQLKLQQSGGSSGNLRHSTSVVDTDDEEDEEDSDEDTEDDSEEEEPTKQGKAADKLQPSGSSENVRKGKKQRVRKTAKEGANNALPTSSDDDDSRSSRIAIVIAGQQVTSPATLNGRSPHPQAPPPAIPPPPPAPLNS